MTVPAFSLYDSAGVDTHLARSTYNSRYPQMNALLSGLNISHIRDSFTSNTVSQSEFKTLYQQYGIDFILTSAVGQTSSEWAQFAMAMGGGLKGIEGVNEPNNGVANWNPASTRQLQKDVWTATHGGQPALAGVKSINASVLSCAGNATYGDQSAYTDFANNHKYWPGVNPGTAGYGGSTCGSPERYGSIGYNIHSVRQSAHHPVYVTEAGYCTANIHRCVPDAVAATYEPEIFLAFFGYNDGNGGIANREYIYEITSEDTNHTGGSLGLTDPNFVPKPMYYAVAGLLKRIKDKPGAVSTQISYSLSGSTPNLRTLPLSYSDGTFGMILWQDVPVWDNNGSATPQGSPISVPVVHPSLTINGKTIQNVTASTYGASGQWSDAPMAGGQPLNLSVGNNMVLVRWSNGGNPPTPTPTPTTTSSASPSPSPSPSPSSSPMATQTPTATPAPSATPAATASPNPSPYPGSSVVAIDAGGHAAGNWHADEHYVGGRAASYYRGAVDVSGVINPAPEGVYQTARTAQTFSYQIPGLTPGTAYTARLHFCENYWTSVGQRIFNVSMSGTGQTLSNYDIVAQAGGSHKAIVVDFRGVTADAQGTIAVRFAADVDNALVNGIEIR